MIPVYDHRGVIGVLGHDGEDPSVLMGKTRGAPSNEWVGRQAFRAATPIRVDVDRIGKILDMIGMGDDEPDIQIAAPSPEARRKLIPRGPVPHHEPAPDAIDDGPQHKPGRLIASHPIVFPARLAPDMTPAKPRWSGTTPELHAAYFDEVKP